MVCQLTNLIYLECLLLYPHAIIWPKCTGSEIQVTVKANQFLSASAGQRYGSYNGFILWNTCYKLENVVSTKFCGVGSFYGGNIFMIKSQTWW